jgi:tRNA uridine 5-carboxymethylaminomethyl modification enzyme
MPHVDAATLEAELTYRGYLKRHDMVLARVRADEARAIPETFDYRNLPGLSREVVQRLSEVRPATIGQAGRIPGVTPAAVAIVAARIGRR